MLTTDVEHGSRYANVHGWSHSQLVERSQSAKYRHQRNNWWQRHSPCTGQHFHRREAIAWEIRRVAVGREMYPKWKYIRRNFGEVTGDAIPLVPHDSVFLWWSRREYIGEAEDWECVQVVERYKQYALRFIYFLFATTSARIRQGRRALVSTWI